jgi:DNA-binding IclR family transcriptional regulator
MRAAQTSFPQSVDRIFSILQFLAGQSGGDSLAAITRITQAPKSSVVSLLAGMVDAGYLMRDDAGRYQIGPVMLALAMRIVSGTNLPALVRPVLERLALATGETALAGALAPDGDLATYIEKVESTNPVRYTVSLGEQRELYSSAIGKLLLAHMEPAQQTAYLRQQALIAFTPATITSVRALRAELSSIREAGISQTRDERVMGASALAAPIFGADGKLVAGLVIAGPSERMRANRAHNISAVKKEAKQLSQLIGLQR